MNNQNFTMTFLADKTPEEVFTVVNNVRSWWGEGVEGGTEKLNDEFVYRHKDIHYSKQKLVEVVPNKKVTWLVTDSYLSFPEKKEEWTGTKISFEIFSESEKTRLLFTHYGLTPACDCYNDCSGGWSYYLQQSLLKLITTGKGEPDAKEIATMKTVTS